MIVIKGMEMPKRCAKCKFCINQKTNDYGSFGECLLQENKKVNCLVWSRDDNCPLVDRALPPITPTRKKGHWIITGDYLTAAYETIDYVKCSCCSEESLEEGDYCPNCGSFMKGEFE